MRRCLETDCRVVLKLSAMAFGVIACNAIRVIIARLVGSAIAWKMSRLILFRFLLAQLFGCKYMRNYLVSQTYFQKYFFQRENVGKFEVAGCRCTITANDQVLRKAGK